LERVNKVLINCTMKNTAEEVSGRGFIGNKTFLLLLYP